MKRALDVQVGGSHYKTQKIQSVEYNHANKLGFIEGSIVKYITRFREKNGVEDLLKIKHYTDLLIELEYPEWARANKAKPTTTSTKARRKPRKSVRRVIRPVVRPKRKVSSTKATAKKSTTSKRSR